MDCVILLTISDPHLAKYVYVKIYILRHSNHHRRCSAYKTSFAGLLVVEGTAVFYKPLTFLHALLYAEAILTVGIVMPIYSMVKDMRPV